LTFVTRAVRLYPAEDLAFNRRMSVLEPTSIRATPEKNAAPPHQEVRRAQHAPGAAAPGRGRRTGGTPAEVVYTPESSLRQPLKLFGEMWRDLLGSRELAWRLMKRDIAAQYRQSFFGLLWAFLPPLVTAAGFTLAARGQVLNVGATDIPYPAYIVVSMALWQTFVESLNGPLQGVTNARQMLSRINFPREALVLAKLGEVFFHFGIKLLLIAGVFLWYQVSVGWTALLAPLALISLVMLGTLLGLLLTPLGALYQDVSKGLLLATGLWLFLTPVVYPIPRGGTFGQIVRLNPVTPLLVTARELATSGEVSNFQGFILVSAVASAGLLGAWVLFRLSMPLVIERMGA
jgi:lipopolysaccharide transport system permease protein